MRKTRKLYLSARNLSKWQRFAIDFSLSYYSQMINTSNLPNDQWGKNPKQLECGCLNYSYDKLYPLFFFRPRYCFRYLAIRMKYYFNIICQCFSVLPFPATTNNKPKAQPNRKCSWYSSKVKILGSQPDVISLIWIDHMFIVPIFNWDLAHILQPRLSSPHIYPSTALSFLAIEELDEKQPHQQQDKL